MKIKNILLSAFSSIALLGAANACAQQSSSTDEEKLYRPAFHFTPKEHWMNDPNGMFYADGVYHLYFQYWPYGNVWGPMHWGHAVSTDMVKWEEQPIALYPDRFGYIFSGSATADPNNTSGFKNGKNTPVVAIFTYHDPAKERDGKTDIESQGIAYSNDNGYTWTKYDGGNPVIENPGIRDFRDPKVTWDEQHNQWLLVLAAQDRSKFYRSDDLKNWEYLSDFGTGIGAHGGVWECPDFFPMKVQGTNETKWVLLQSLNPGGPNNGSATQYFIGDFDGKTFTQDKAFAEKTKTNNGVWLDYGKDNYAGVTWNNVPQQDGRKLMIGWMSNWEYATVVPTQKWRSSMTVARELKLKKNGSDYLITSVPVAELDRYISKTVTKEKIKVFGKAIIAEAKDIDLSKADIRLTLKPVKNAVTVFTLSNSKGEYLRFGIDTHAQQLFIDRAAAGSHNFSDKFAAKPSTAPITDTGKEVKFRIILDKTSIEIFYNDGEKAMTEIFFLSEPFTEFSALGAKGTQIKDLTLNQLNIN